jgi:hypothetical protein
LAFAAPPLIFVVGELDDKFLTLNGTSLRWLTSKNDSIHTSRKLFDLSKLFDRNSAPDGIVGSREIVKRWLIQADSYTNAKLVCTTDKVIYGKELADTERTYEAHEHDSDETVIDSVFANCTCSHGEENRCLHYIQ